MKEDNLKQKATSGIIWTAVQKYSKMAISFISGITLARLLTPDDYGAIGMLVIFMSLAEVFIDAGFGSALIQKKEPTQTDYSTVFYFNLVMSLILYLVLFCCAPIIAEFYRMPILCKVLRVQGLVLFIYAFNIIQLNQIRKSLHFKKLSIITIITALISLMAYSGFGVWALVSKYIIEALIPCIFFWLTTNWHPTWEYSWRSFKELFGFGFFMLLSHLFNTFCDKISGLLIGRWYNPATLGYYTQAMSTEELASTSISGVMKQTTYPLYATIQDDKKRMAYVIKRITSSLAYITVPFMCILIVVADQLFVLLLSDKWLPSVPYFRILCIAGMCNCLQTVNHQPMAAIGKSDVMFIWVVIKRSVGIILQIGGIILWGIKGLLIGIVIASWFSYIVNISLVSKYIGYKHYQQLKDIAPIFFVSGFAALASYLSGRWMGLSFYPTAVVEIFIFIAIYFGWSFFFRPEAYTYSLSILDIIKSKNHRK